MTIKKELFVNVWRTVKSTPYFLYMFIGGRGVGKTYSTLEGVLNDKAYFMYVRRTETELKNSCKQENNPFTTINENTGRNVEISASGDTFVIHENDEVIGVAGALSTFGKFRGSDFSKVQYIIFDEFISTNRVKIKDESDAFFNMIETVQRNRELMGEPSIKIIMLSNANSIDNEIIKTLRLGEIIHQMKITGVELYTDDERGIYLNLLKPGELAKAKSQTKLYKLTKGTDFYDMAIGNEFTSDSFDDVYKIRYQDLTPIVAYENIYFYSVKNKNLMYCSYRKADVDKFTKDNFTAFKRQYGLIFDWYITNNKIVYYDYDVKLFVKNMWN